MSGISNGYFATGNLIGIPGQKVVDFVVKNSAGEVVANKANAVETKTDGKITQFKVFMPVAQFSDTFSYEAVVAGPNGVPTPVTGSLSYNDDE